MSEQNNLQVNNLELFEELTSEELEILSGGASNFRDVVNDAFALQEIRNNVGGSGGSGGLIGGDGGNADNNK